MRTQIETKQYVACQPGFFALTLLTECKDEPVGVNRQIVVEWLHENGSTVPIPVTLDGTITLDYAIEQPSGEVYVPGRGESFENCEEWLDECKARWAEQQRYEATLAQNGIDVRSYEAKSPAAAQSSARAAIQAALAAAGGKVSS